MSACCCMGPQNGEPLCPCKMRGVKIINGRYVRIEDLGSVADQAYATILQNIRDRLSEQEPLGYEFSKVLNDNLWNLYVTNEDESTVDKPQKQLDDQQEIITTKEGSRKVAKKFPPEEKDEE